MSGFIPLRDIESSGLGQLPLEYPFFPVNGEGIRTLPGIPGVRCKKCAENGKEVWVVPGLYCPECQTPAPDDSLAHSCHDD
ncbi:hypothetical protein C8A03DRAFT_16775 [Achaetomium macrosporum]|uniref:Uncharacterized protein n=1 Tax=Achaetomium macrosporum TaxID=79813 RepID=A0AAN7HDZ0_9PEZI|nr:hypothetical protein C8A03DRAFT_16775 [Achaetomium macrosporum]